MPADPSSARKTSRHRRSATDSAANDRAAFTPSGLYQSTAIQDRVRQWQSHGAASAAPPDAVSIFSSPCSEASVAPLVQPDSPDDAEDLNHTRNSRRRVARNNESSRHEQIRRIRASSTPRKRIVSDEHWKANRGKEGSPRPSPRPEPRRAESPVQVPSKDDEQASPDNVPPKSPGQRSIKKARAEREERRRRRLETRKMKSEILAQPSGDAFRTSAVSEPYSDSELAPPKVTSESHNNNEHMGPLNHSSSRHRQSPSEFGHERRSESPEGMPRVRSRYAETLGQPPPSYLQDSQVKSKKGSFFAKTKEKLGITESTPTISNRLPSIEAWLFDQPDQPGQPDPFVDGAARIVHEDVEIVKPLKKRSVKRKTSVRNTVPDPNQIWDLVGNYREEEVSEQPVVEGKVSQSPVQESTEAEAASPSSLKRRTAKSSRIKRHKLPQIPSNNAHLVAESMQDAAEASPKQTEHRAERSCPQTGVTRLSTIASVETIQNQSTDNVNNEVAASCELKRKLTTHEDMMSVLSRPVSRRGTRKKRSVRTTTPQTNTDATKQILEVVAEDEAKYSRELRTLVDGVIPVLLQCVLSKTDAVAAAGLFTHSVNPNNSLEFTRPIIDMGVALERLKTLHNRIPLQNVDNLLSWCQTAHKAYSEYLKCWKLGFQDVVVNLAPLEDSEADTNEVMARDESGDIVNAEGDKVDVAYLMKRPLVQIRKIGRALNDLKDVLIDNPVAGKIAEDYNDLTAAAKNKHQQEKARLEDEAAAHTDATKCRDIKTMAPLPDVVIDKTRRVRARDCFSMTLYHSTGQRMDCKVELILRDNHHSSPDGGDLLICQFDQTGKWLLFSPVETGTVSARRGEAGWDLVLMLRGRAGIGQEWRELLALKADDPEAAAEWMTMLGSNPLPPKLNRVPSFVNQYPKEKDLPTPSAAVVGLTKATLERVPSIESLDVPIGEPSVLSVVASRPDDAKFQEKTPAVERPTSKPTTKIPEAEKPPQKLSLGGGLQRKPVPELQTRDAITQKPGASSLLSSDKSTVSGFSVGSSSGYTPSSLAPAYFPHPNPEQVERHKKRHTLSAPCEVTPDVRASSSPPRPNPQPQKTVQFSSAPPTEITSHSEPRFQHEQKSETLALSEQSSPKRPSHARTLSSTPSQDAPIVPRVRELPNKRPTKSPVKGPTTSVPLTDSIRETWASISGLGRKSVSQPVTPVASNEVEKDAPISRAPIVQQLHQRDDQKHSAPALLPAALAEKQQTGKDEDQDECSPPPPPEHKYVGAANLQSRNMPKLRPSAAQQKMDRRNGRPPSSPLRKEVALSTPSASPSDQSSSESEFSEDDSQTSEEFQSELFDMPMPMPLMSPADKSPSVETYAKAPSVPATTGTRTLAPSDSASQGPYRRVPSSADRPGTTRKRAVAMICSWSDNGQWSPIRDEFCSIIVSPGLIEVFPMDEFHSGHDTITRDPIVAFELTPLVPLRKPTGIDISIRSPPTPNSQIKTTNNVMFRSHSPLECETLYHMINWSRCNNPTYIQLERSRPRPQPAVTFSNQEAPRPRSWFSFGGGIKRRNSYRVGNVPPSSMGDSQATTNTVSSALSALKRLSKSSAFNVNRSSVIRRPGLTTNASLYSASSGTGMGSGSSTPQPSQLGAVPGKEGPNVPPTSAAAANGGGMVHNMKIKLSVRKGRDWVQLGVSRLSVLPGVSQNDITPGTSRPGSSGSTTPATADQTRRLSSISAPGTRHYRLPSSGFTPHRFHGDGREKRVVITANGRPDQVMLDVTLGESCFEKVAHLGIAMQVWKEDDSVRSKGGVVLGQNAVYMLQFYHQQDCAWVFGLVGTYRYSNNMMHSQE